MKNRILLFLLIFMMLIGKMYSRDGTEPEGYVPNKGIEDPPVKTMTIKSPLNVKDEVVNVTFTVVTDLVTTSPYVIEEDNGTPTKATVTVELFESDGITAWNPQGKKIKVSMGYGGTASIGGSYPDYTFENASTTTSTGFYVEITGTTNVASFDIIANSDDFFEADETIDVFISNVECTSNCVGLGFEAGDQHEIITITDTNDPPVITLSVVDDYNDVNENAVLLGEDPDTYVTATMTGYTLEQIRTEITVNLSFAGDAENDDYTVTDNATTIIIPEYTGEPTTIPEVKVTINDDIYYEGNEDINVTITDITADGHNEATDIWDESSSVIIAIIDNEVQPTVTLNANPLTIDEGDTPDAGNSSVVTATLFPNPCQDDVIVNLGFTGTALKDAVGDDPADYTVTASGIITIVAKTETTGTINVTTIPDDIYENSETVFIEITTVENDQGATENSTPQEVSILISNDDEVPVVTLTTSATTVNEAEANNDDTNEITIILTLDKPSNEDVVVDLAFTPNGTYPAIRGTDYNADNSVTIDAGQSQATVTLTAIEDVLYEKDNTTNESFNVAISAVNGGGATGTSDEDVTIIESLGQPTVNLTVIPNTINEDGGTATVTAFLDYKSVYEDVEVTLGDFSDGNDPLYPATKDGDIDYIIGSETITIVADELNATTTITGNPDDIYEGNEDFQFSVTTATNTNNNNLPIVKTATIIDAEEPPKVTLRINTDTETTHSVAETSSTINLIVTTEFASANDITVHISHLGDTEDADWSVALLNDIVITIDKNTLSKTLVLTTAATDALYEGAETETFEIETVDGAIEDGSQEVTLTITDDDGAPTITVISADGNLDESVTDDTETITVATSVNCEHDITVTLDYPYDNSPVADAEPSGDVHPDYSGEETTIVIPATGANATLSTTSFEIKVVNDIIDEPVENIVIDIDKAEATLDDGPGSFTITDTETVTITDDDATPAIVSFNADNTSIHENGGIDATITAVLDHPTEIGEVVITWTIDGTSTAVVADYTVIPTSGTDVTIPIFETEATIVITPVDDDLYEGDQTVIATITNAINATEAGETETVTIIDDELLPVVTLSLDKVMIKEEDVLADRIATVTATLSCARELGNIVLDFAFTGTATETTDYADADNGGAATYVSGTKAMTFEPGNLTGSFTITAEPDDIFESPSETVIATATVNAGANANADVLNNPQTITITDDESSEPLEVILVLDDTLDKTTGTINEAGTTTTKITAVLTSNGTFTNTAISGEDVYVTIDYDSNSTADETDDYTIDYATDGNPDKFTIKISAGNSIGQIDVTAVDDAYYEYNNGDNEDLIIDIVSVIGATEYGDQKVTISIDDAQSVPTLTLSTDLTDNKVDEGDGSITIKGEIATMSDRDITFTLDFADVTATADDYDATTAVSMTILSGETTTTGDVTIFDDNIFEGNEIFKVSSAAVTNDVGAGAEIEIKIVDDEENPTVTLSVDKTTIGETEEAIVTATLSHKSTQDITVTVTLSGIAVGTSGTNATDWSDITWVDSQGTGISNVVDNFSIVAGDLTDFVRIINLDELVYDEAEVFTATLSAPYSYCTLGNADEIVVTITAINSDPLPTVIFGTAHDNITEGNATQGDVIVEIDPTTIAGVTHSYLPIEVSLEYANDNSTEPAGNAIFGTDYTAPLTLTIPGDRITITGNTSVIDDLIDEPTETVDITITGVSGGIEDGNQKVSFDIIDNEDPPTVNLSVSSNTITESGGIAQVTATLSHATYQDVVVTLATEDGTGYGGAVYNDDYTLESGTITIAAGSLQGSKIISAAPDEINEYNEIFTVEISVVTTNATLGGITHQVITITDDDDDPLVTLTETATVDEGEPFTLKATLSRANSTDITVTLDKRVLSTANPGTVGDTDVDYEDFTTITILAGSFSETITMQTANDDVSEGDETIEAYIASVVPEGILNAVIGTPSEAIITIADDEATPIVNLWVDAVDTDTKTENEGDSFTLIAELETQSPVDMLVTLAYSSTGDDNLFCNKGSVVDYNEVLTVTIPAFTDKVTFEITTVNDNIFENNEVFTAVITNISGNGIISTDNSSVVLTIDDNNDALPVVTLSEDGSPIPENEGTATVTATLSNANEKKDVIVTIDYADNNGTATWNDDYTAADVSGTGSSTQITIPRGDISGDGTITAIQDDRYEAPSESVEFKIKTVTTPDGATSAGNTVTVIINDDDPMPAVSFLKADPNPVKEGDADMTVDLNFVLDRASNYASVITVKYSGITAQTGIDFTTGSVTLEIPAGQTTGIITDAITVTDDLIGEIAETIKVEIIGVSNCTESGVQELIVTIDDDDAPNVESIVVGDGTHNNEITEGGVNTTVIVTLDKVSTSDQLITLIYRGTAGITDATNPGNTTNDPDYERPGDVAVPMNVTIDANQLSTSFKIVAPDDGVYDIDEVFIIDGYSPAGISNTISSNSTTIIDDTSEPNLTLSNNGDITEGTADNGIVTATLDAAAGMDVVITLGFTGSASNDKGVDYNVYGNGTGADNGTFVDVSDGESYHETKWTILAGDTKATLTINAIDDWLYEKSDALGGTYDENVNEHVGVYVVSATNALTFDDQRQDITIVDAQEEPKVKLVARTTPITANDETVDLYTNGLLTEDITEGDDPTDAANAYLTPVLEWRSIHIVTLNVSTDANADNTGTATEETEVPTVLGDNDYDFENGATGLFTIFPGQTYPTSDNEALYVKITTVPDDINEANETVIYDIELQPDAQVANYSHTSIDGSNGTATVTILDDDPLTYDLWVKDSDGNDVGDFTHTITEVDEEWATVGITLNRKADSEVTIDLYYRNPDIGYAERFSDYEGTPTTHASTIFTFTSGDTEKSTIIKAVDDPIYERNENVEISAPVTNVTIGNGNTNVTVVDNDKVNVIIEDDEEPPTVTLTLNKTVITESDTPTEANILKIGADLSHQSVWDVVIPIAFDENESEAYLTAPGLPEQPNADFTADGNEIIVAAMDMQALEPGGAVVTINAVDDDWYEGEINEVVKYDGETPTIITTGPYVNDPAEVHPTYDVNNVTFHIIDNEDLPKIEFYTTETDIFEDIATGTITSSLLVQIGNVLGADEDLDVYIHFDNEIDDNPVDDLTALWGFDYTVTGGTLPNNSLLLTIPAYTKISNAATITALDDPIYENPDEHILADISEDVIYYDAEWEKDSIICDTLHSNVDITIVDDDYLPIVDAIYIDVWDRHEQNVNETDNGKTHEVWVNLSNPTSDDVSVFVTYSGAATYKVGTVGDYECTVGTNGDDEFPDTWFLVPASHTTNNVNASKTLTFYNDDIYEVPDEHVLIDITHVSALSEITQANSVDFTITDNEALPIVESLTVVNDGTNNSAEIYELADANNSTTATIIATLDHFTTEDVVITLGSNNGSGDNAAEAGDYVIENTITIPANSLTGTTTVTANYDVYYEGNEVFNVWANNIITGDATLGTGVGFSDSNPVNVTIVDAQAKPIITVTANPASIAEDGGSTDITFTTDVLSENAISVDYVVNNGTTEGADDFTIENGNTGTVTINSGVFANSFTITSLEDCYHEGDNEILNIDGFTTSDDASVSNTTHVEVTIIDAEARPEISLTTSTDLINENGDEGANITSTLTATLNHGTTVGIVTIPLDYSGMATHNETVNLISDYYGAESITIPVSTSNATGGVCFTENTTVITSINEVPRLYEGTETILISVGEATHAVVNGVQQRTITILDDETEPTANMVVSTDKIKEEGTTSTNVTAELDYARQYGDVTLNIVYSGDYEDSDLTVGGSSLTISAGATTSNNFDITATDDDIDEDTETIYISVEDVDNAINGNSAAEVEIIDNDELPVINITTNGNYIIYEDAGDGDVEELLTVKLTHATERSDIVVNFTHAASSTAETDDYELDSYSVTIPMNTTEETFTITSVNDLVYEGSETVYMEVTTDEEFATTTNGDATFDVTIIDNEDPPTVTLSSSVNNNTINESAGSFTLKAELNNATAFGDVEVTLGFAGVANVGDDYTFETTLITIPQGEISAVLEIPVIDDNMYEIDEDIIVNITNVTNATEDGTQTETITIVSDDAIPTVTLTTSDETIEEDNGIAELTVTLSHPTYEEVTIDYSFTGTATTADLYYNTDNVSVIIPAASSNLSSSITLNSLPDDIYEGNETVIVDIDVTNADELDAQQVTVNIIDAETEPTVTLSANVNEIAEAGGQSVITATLSHATIHPVAVTLDYTGTATDDVDYTHEAIIDIEIAAGVLSGTVTITGVYDEFYEGANETVIVDILGVENATEVATQQQTVTILDGQVYPTVTIVDNTTINEDGASVITATLDNKTLEEVVVTLAYTGTADYDVDYEAELTLTIPSNTYSGTVTVESIDDDIDENNENVIVNIDNVTNANEGSPNEATVTITDNDDTPYVILTVDNSVNNSVEISEEGGDFATLTATLSHRTHIGDVSVPLLVDYVNSSALSGIDYELLTSTIIIPMDALSATTTISSIDDLMFELDETVIVNIDGDAITYATEHIDNVDQTVTILNNDSEPTVTLTTDDSTIEEDDGEAVLSVNISNPTYLDVAVDFTYTGTAIQGTDYNIANTLTIPSGDVEATITLNSVPDAIHEGNETVIVDISAVTNADEETVQKETVTIFDAETEPIITLLADVNTIAEDGSEATLTTSLSHYSTLPVTVTLAYTGTADRGDDYDEILAIQTITIPPMALSRTTVVKSIVDDIYEGVDETVIVDISEVANAIEVITEQKIITITDAQVYPIVTIAASPISISENGGTSVITATLNNKTIENVNIEFAYTGVALNGIDYSVVSTIDIPKKNISGEITIESIDDNVYEGNENIIINIDDITNASIGTTNSASVTINDNEGIPDVTLSIDPVSINEAGGVADIEVELEHPSIYPVIVNIASAGVGTATEGDDYYYGDALITIEPLGTTGATTVTAVDDGIYEGATNETFDVTYTVSGGNVITSDINVTIIDGQSTPPTADMSVNLASVQENGGLANVIVTLDYPTVEDVEIDFTFSGEAVKEEDYNTTATESSIIIASGEVSGLFTFNSLNDNITEGDEEAVIDMTVTNAIVGVGTQTIMILDDEDLPIVSMFIDTENVNENEEALVTVELTNPSDEDITVNFAYSGTAIGDAVDYTTSANQVVVTALTTLITMTISTIDDGILEGDETVVVDIESVSSNSVEAGNQQVTLIVHDAQSAINASLAVIGSGDCQNGTFNITILAAEDGVEYKAYFNDFNEPLNTKTGDGSDLEIEIEESDLEIGDNTISIYADNVNVINDEITLANKALVTLYENYIIKGDTVDLGSNGTVSIIETQENVDYEIYVGNSNRITTVTGTGYTVNIPIASEYLTTSSTENDYDIIVKAIMLDETKTCQIDDIDNDADFIYVIENPTVPQAFSPNGDGVNDNFFIKDVQIYEYSSIVIMNRHGQKVYEATPYKNDWDGKTMFGNEGEDLPEGTYFYILKLGTDEEPMKGYVYIKR